MRLFLFAIALLGSWLAPHSAARSNQRSASTFEWPSAPLVDIDWRPRGSTEELALRLEVQDADWVVTDNRRYARIDRRLDDVALLVWFEQFEGLGATRVTVGAINGLPNVGPRYFERYAVKVGAQQLIDLEGRHVILPRGALIRRAITGRHTAEVREWTYVRQNRPVPSWAPAEAERDTLRRTSFPFRDQDGKPVDLGPYNFFWPNQNLADSHGGGGIGPFHGGPEDWLACPAGRKNREAEMLLDFQRPIWMLDDDFQPFEPQVAYWMGRTRQHEPPQYQYELDDWCPYAQLLSRYTFADYTHLSRGTSGAAALAAWDQFAFECLRAVLTDFKTANSLQRYIGEDVDGEPILHPGAVQTHSLHFPLWKKIETANGPTSRGGDRGLAHELRLLRWCRPYFPREELEPYEDGLRELARKLADEYGVTHAESNQPWMSEPGGRLSKPLYPPYCQTFHQQLVTYEFERFGGLDDLAEKSRRFLTSRPPSFFEVREGLPDDTVYDRNSTADSGQQTKFYAYEAYGSLTHGILLGYEDAQSFLHVMSTRGINGSSQDLDNVPRALWKSGLE